MQVVRAGRNGSGTLPIPVLRTARALFMFWTIFASYGLHWLAAKVLGGKRIASRWERVHRNNARRLVNGFTRLRGVFIKVGQVLSVIGTFLPRAYGEALEKLQDRVPTRPFHEIEGRLCEALGDDPLSRFAEFDREPLAAASLAQVHRAVTKDGTPVAVKVLYPGIERLIRTDLGVLRSIMPVVGRIFPITRFERVLDQLAAMLARETDYANERKNMERLRAVFQGRKDVVVPRVVDELTNAGVLTMTFEEGTKITDFASLKKQDIDTEAVARLLTECYFSMLLEHQVFHADPHPGNFLVRPGPTLVILDYGAVEDVTQQLADGMRMVVLGAITRDDEQVLAGLEGMGFVAEGGDRELLARVGREYLKMLSSIKITDFAQLDRQTVEKLTVDGYQQVRGQLREIMKSVEYPDGYFYVERTLVLLFGLVGQLAPKVGLPGLVLPYASLAFAKSLAAQSPPSPPTPPTEATA
jgi:predicted unusual protein kinase regulating ubiquinone biosynthesis (AarF/ABC1/UbiB family)